MKTRSLILDTDMGSDVDDALALGLALASPEIDLVAVTTVSREPLVRARIARKLLDLAGRRDVPVFTGSERSLSEGDAFVWFGNEGVGILEADEPLAVEPEPAVDAMARLLRERDGLEVCAVGPMTNVAHLLARHPAAAARIARLTIMGGHVRDVAYGGCSFPHGVDYNLCSDAAASLAVLRSDLPIRLVTADVTLCTWITPADVDRLAAHGGALQAALARAVRAWTPVMRDIFSGMGATMGDDNAAFLHDPLALASVHDESFCRFEDLAVEAVVRDGVFRTIEAARASEATRTMRCATAVDAERFRAHVMERLLRRAA
ncbi:MAG TPA: nucleoside hydrolase [Candidatus Binatia bacterium]|nr:nucleoside hydrolase [Candidatus Binatia bacterium]